MLAKTRQFAYDTPRKRSFHTETEGIWKYTAVLRNRFDPI